MKKIILSQLLVIGYLLNGFSQDVLDKIVFGNTESETMHQFKGDKSRPVKGVFDATARVILKPDTVHWQGGTIGFDMKVDSEKQNYITVKFWGSDLTKQILLLFIEGKQLGYRHLGDIDILDISDNEPMCEGRFFYKTTPLPLKYTKGKTSVKIEIVATGIIWSYATNFQQYQKNMDKDSRPIYAAYTHTDGCFTPLADEKQGLKIQNPPIHANNEVQVMSAIKARVNKTVDKFLASKTPLNQNEVLVLAKAYHLKWTSAYKNENVARLIVECGDNYYRKFKEDPDLVYKDKATSNPEWNGLSGLSEAILWVEKDVKFYLSEKVALPDLRKVKRRELWAEMFEATRDYLRKHRRWYTNQTMYIDMAMYWDNKCLRLLAPEKALSEEKALAFLHEAAGVTPWLGIDKFDGTFEKKLGDGYFQISAKGLTKELGYVGYYGEVSDMLVTMCHQTGSLHELKTGDPKIRDVFDRYIKARSYFRYPTIDIEGKKGMRIQAVVGWRDTHLPGSIVYVERGNPLATVATLQTPETIAWAQQMMEDNQLFTQIQDYMTNPKLRWTLGIIDIPEQYEWLKKQPKVNQKLPMTEGQPDCVFSDEEVGVLAIKKGDELLYISNYWRARNGINFLARVHHVTPQYECIANVYEDIIYEQNGTDVYKRPNWINFGFSNGGMKYPVKIESAHWNEELPIAKIPTGTTYKLGEESVYAGRGLLYTVRYGKYLIYMNMAKDKDFDINIPADFQGALELVSKQKFQDKTVQLKAQKTLVFYKQ